MGFEHPTITAHATPDPRVRLYRSDPEVDCFAVVTQRFVAVVDTFSTPEEAGQLMTLLKADLAGRELLVINTHQHYDHAWGNALFTPDGPYPAPIIAHARALDELDRPEFREASAKSLQEPRFASVQLIPPTITFRDSLTLHGADLTLELLPAPGHAPDQIVVWIPELRFLLAADALEHPWPYVEGAADLHVLLDTMHNLKHLGAEVVLPCHGGTQDAGLIDRNLAYFAALREVVRARSVPDDWETCADLADALGYPMGRALADLGLSEALGNVFYADSHEKNLRATVAAEGRG